MTQAQIIEDEIPQAQVAVLSGPTHAEEVSRGIPTTIVAGSKSKRLRGICAESVHERSVPCLYQPGCTGH